MAKEQKKAKGTNETKPAKRKLDPEMEELRKPERGKKKHQQLKAYMVLECLMRETNEKKPLSARDIVAYLDDFGISAEATSVRNDIKEINYVMYMLEYGCTIDIAIEELDSGDYEEDKFIKYSQKKKGYYISRNRNNITENDVRVIAECIYASRFITEKQADHLVDIACNLVSARAAERIKNKIRVSKEKKEVSSDVFYKVSTILEALSEGSIDSPHAPEKITFSYQSYVIDDVKKTAIKKNWSYHKVSPNEIRNSGDRYYLLATNEKQTRGLFEIDHMNDIRLTGEMQDEESLSFLSKKKGKNVEYLENRRVKPVKAMLLCANSKLDKIVPVFGTGEDVEYSTYDSSCFLLTKTVVPDNEFFRLLIDFYDSIKILEPDSLVEEYFHFLERPKQLYSGDVPKMSLYPKHKRTFIDPKEMLASHTNNQTLLEMIQELRKYYDDSEMPWMIKLERVLKKEVEYFSGPKGAERIKELEMRIQQHNESLKDQNV